MSYRCGLCGSQVPPNQPRRVHIIYREIPVVAMNKTLPRSKWGKLRSEIAAEIPACQQCLQAIADGVDLHELISEGRKLQQVEERKRLSRLTHSSNPIGGDGGSLEVEKSKVKTRFIYPPPPVRIPNSEGRNGGVDEREVPKCDVCGMDATDGQVTADTVLCAFHCKKAMGK